VGGGGRRRQRARPAARHRARRARSAAGATRFGFKDDEGHPIAQSAAQALKLARELGRLLDELAIEGVSFSQLEGLVEGNFASHWQRTLKFLAIVGEAWPQVLAERGQIDAIERRTQAIRAQAARWAPSRPPRR